MQTSDRIALLEKELDRLLQWVRAAESRLALVLPLATAMLGALAVSIPDALNWTVLSGIAASFSVFFLALSILFSALATFPRTTGPKGSLVYFGGIEAMEPDQFKKAVSSLTDDRYIDDLSSQCHRNAQVAAKKYAWIQRAMACLFLASAPWAITLLSLYIEK